MVIAYHLVITTYGFWLPNDPRGSWSDFVRSWELFRFGGATTTDERRSLARDPHDWRKRIAAKEALAREPVSFTGEQALAVARGFAHYCERSGCTLYACAIMPEHAHFVVARHRYSIEQVSNLLKGAASTRLTDDGLHPFAGQPYKNGKLPTPWARKQWKCYLNDRDGIVRAIRYVEGNPQKEGKKTQRWWFVTPFV
jgi:REP element-mobilizing transposase RayT